jgi:PAS domain S-box-containing protein
MRHDDHAEKKLKHEHCVTTRWLDRRATTLRNKVEGVCIVRARDGTIAHASREFSRMFGYEQNELTGLHISALHFSASPELALAAATETLAEFSQEGVHSYEMHNVKKDGTAFWCRATSSAFEHAEFGQVFVTVHDDISARKRQEFKLRGEVELENEKARHAIRIREEILAVVSHDLKNPLSSIDMAASMIQKGIVPPERMLEYANRVRRSVAQAMKLIDGLLDFAKIQSGTFSVDKSPENAAEVIMPSLEQHRMLAEANGITLECQLPPSLGSFPCDSNRLNQVLSNLLGNAIKFTPDGGTIRIEALETPSEIIISVADTGYGMAPEQLPKVFDRYWQAESTKRLGTGLGLAIAEGIVKAHGGRIWVESDLGKGTRFSFAIPTERLPHQAST